MHRARSHDRTCDLKCDDGYTGTSGKAVCTLLGDWQGDIFCAKSATVTSNTDLSVWKSDASRGCADGAVFTISRVAGVTVDLTPTLPDNCLSPLDEVVVYDLAPSRPMSRPPVMP